ncbi:MAG TPA: GNAT family N-acetyltransferase [Phycisphaerae bacterium]|nr:GNAT family N-acetyltransferase [Phycisphaerae bacterium]
MSAAEGPGTSRRIEKLTLAHKIDAFDCGREELNRYLLRYAWTNQQAGAGQTYIGSVGETLVGYHTLTVGHVLSEQAPERISKGLTRHPIPVMLLARLAVDQRWHGQGIGKALLKDAMLRTLQAAEIVGIRAMTVHAKNDDARKFYEKFDFVASPTDPMHLFVLLKDARRSVLGK